MVLSKCQDGREVRCWLSIEKKKVRGEQGSNPVRYDKLKGKSSITLEPSIVETWPMARWKEDDQG